MYIPRHTRRLLGTPLTLAGALCACVFAFAACSTDESSTAPSAPSAGPGFLISDGVHSNGLQGFYWLLPTLTKTKFPGNPDPNLAGLNPVVSIRTCSDDNCSSVGATVAQFTRTSTPAPITYKGGQYQVTWSTSTAGTYRLDVVAGALGFRRTLGQADVKLFTSRPASTTQRIGWKVGNPFPIAFRIETRIAGSITISPTTATITPGGSQQFTATLRDLHGALLGAKNVSWQSASTPTTGVIASLTPLGGPTNASGQALGTVTAGSTPGTATVYAISNDQASPVNRLFATATLNVRAPGWTMTNLDEAGGYSGHSYGTGVNNSGQAVGYFQAAQTHAAIWQNGTRTDLTPLVTGGSEASGINDLGQVVGHYNASDRRAHAVIWQPDGTVTELDNLGSEAVARAINAAGDVAGNSTLAGDAEGHAVLWHDGITTDLGTLGGFVSVAMALNNTGQVVGWSYTTEYSDPRAVLWANNTVKNLGTLGGTTSEAHGVNDQGQVVGFSTLEGDAVTHAVLWQPDGTMIDLGTLGGSQSAAYAINNAGQVAGYSTTAGDAERHAFRWEAGAMTDISVVGERSRVVDWPRAIDEAGNIVGQSSVGDRQHATLWTAP